MLLRFCIIEKKSINLQRCVLPDVRLRNVDGVLCLAEVQSITFELCLEDCFKAASLN